MRTKAFTKLLALSIALIMVLGVLPPVRVCGFGHRVNRIKESYSAS